VINGDTGGPAFPEQVVHSEAHGFMPASAFAGCEGLSKRDYFACAVLGGLGGISTELAQVATNRGLLFSDIVAGYCYEIADAMLAARSKPKV